MAAADYYGCDLCGSKTFYDAELDYDFPTVPPYEPKLPGVGAMKVICLRCADTHEVTIALKSTAAKERGEA